eukprot:14069648-Heterocapsa_arctica.AAC.1
MSQLPPEFDVSSKPYVVRHQAKRAWAVYRACRALRHMGGSTSFAIEPLVGHLVHYFMLSRAGLIAID